MLSREHHKVSFKIFPGQESSSMSWVPIIAIQDLSQNLGQLSSDEVDDIINSLTVSRRLDLAFLTDWKERSDGTADLVSTS